MDCCLKLEIADDVVEVELFRCFGKICNSSSSPSSFSSSSSSSDESKKLYYFVRITFHNENLTVNNYLPLCFLFKSSGIERDKISLISSLLYDALKFSQLAR
jgi:hypothetical protein